MFSFRKKINNLSKKQKIIFSVLVVLFIIILSISIPTFSRYKNRTTILTATLWDGSVATNYKKGSGTLSDPYIISSGSELAYFSNQLLTTDYANTYFSLSNDIKLNEGVLKYDDVAGVQYILNDQTYYVKKYTNEYYDNVSRTGIAIGTLNQITSLNNFKGVLNGNSYTIYGLYITSSSLDKLGLFTDLEGTLNDLYVTNALVYGGNVTGGIASNSNNAAIKNILYNGYVIGNDNYSSKIEELDIANLSLNNNGCINLNSTFSSIGKQIISTTLTGNYVVDEDTQVSINGIDISDGSFNIDLGDIILDNVTVNVASQTAMATFTNLQYNITYKESVVGGLIGNSNNTTITNSINKADIYGYKVSGGLIGRLEENGTILQSYNTGSIIGQIGSGIIGLIDQNDATINLTNSYNSGDITSDNNGGIIGIINNAVLVNLNNIFDITNNYAISSISNSTVNVSNCYMIYQTAVKSGSTNGSFNQTSLNNFNDKAFLENISYNQFNNYDDYLINNSNAWVFEKNSLPILFIDDLNNPVANINVSTYTWNNLSFDLNKIHIDNNITFNIEAINDTLPLKELYYYISDSTNPLSMEQINQIDSWVPYSGIVQITDEGSYIIYVKTVDYDDDVTYLNTDILLLDLSGADINISLDDHNWSTLKNSLNYVYIDEAKNIFVEANDSISGVASLKYYIANQVLDINSLDALDESLWINYDSIILDQIGTYVIYIKAVDNAGYVTYCNTDYIVLDGYQQDNIIAGRNGNYSGLNITNKSLITTNFSFNSENVNIENTTHNLISNILFPIGTKITIFDNIYNKIYQYKISTDLDIYGYNDSCSSEECIKKATYPFTLFKEVGTTNILYSENDYIVDNKIEENFKIVIDFSDTNIISNYENVCVYVELHNGNNNVRPTLKSTLSNFNIYTNNSNFYLNTDYTGSISYDTNATTNININSGISYVNDVIDTTYEDQNIGLMIKLVDGNGNIINKEYYKNMIFKIDNINYYPNSQNIIYINLNNSLNINKVLSIINDGSNNKLNAGIYYFKINSYSSYDGYNGTLSNDEITIPLEVGNNNIIYGYDVKMDDTNRIIDKTQSSTSILFNISQNGNLNSPNIKVSLYKKNSLTAYNQDYTIVDLKDYISNDLDLYNSYIYNAIDNPITYDNTDETYNNFTVNLINSNFEKTGYKFVFDLYDGETKIGTIEKYFIVR